MEVAFKEPGYAWLTASDANHNHLGTWFVPVRGTGKSKELDAVADKCSHVSVTVLRQNKGLVGTAVFSVTPGEASEAAAPLWACRSSSHTKKSHDAVTLRSRVHAVAEYIPHSCSCCQAFAEQSWPAPVCSGTGYDVLRATNNVDSTAALAARWDTYCKAATLLLGGNTDNLDIFLATALQRGAGHYEPEEIDDRGAAEITLCCSQDCDGQATSVALFANMMICHAPDVQVEYRSLLDYLCKHFKEAAVITGYARAPRKGETSKPFGHAWAALIRHGAPANAPLHNCLLLEATAPISPVPGTHGGVIVNATATAREKLARAKAPRAKQIVVGVREFLPWYYGKLWNAYGANWAVDYSEADWHQACGGLPGTSLDGCKMPDAELRLALYPRLTRSQAQSDLPRGTQLRVTAPQQTRYALASTDGVAEIDPQILDHMSTHQWVYF